MRKDYIRIPFENAGYFLTYARDAEALSYIEDSNGDLLILGAGSQIAKTVEEITAEMRDDGRWLDSDATVGEYLSTTAY